MTADPTVSLPNSPPEPRPTAGMTTKVVKGSFWTLAGQVAPLGASLIATPFVIRFLGSAGYGVLILTALIPAYFNFADFGMGMASTKFGSEAFGNRDQEKEGLVIRTSAAIALLFSLPIALLIFAFSPSIVELFTVPRELLHEASLALRIASVTFVINFLNSIFNTPQLARLRMDLNTLVTSGFRVAGIVSTPVVIYLGGGVVGAVSVLLISSLLTFASHLYVSGGLLSGLIRSTLDRQLVKPLLIFGTGYASSAIAAVILGSTEKLVLARTASVKELAYYSVAFTIASMMTLLSGAMTQSLVPAFAQLQGSESALELSDLYARCIRLASIVFLPALVFVAIIARPFLTVWAGPEIGNAAVRPLDILLFGLVFNAVAYFPCAIIIASGRTKALAKLYWGEVVLYLPIVFFAVNAWGIIGAAVAWSVRVICDALCLFFLAKRVSRVSPEWRDRKSTIVVLIVIFMPVIATRFFEISDVAAIAIYVVALASYIVIVWLRLLQDEERRWLLVRINGHFAK